MIYKEKKACCRKGRSYLAYDLFFLTAVLLILTIFIILIKQ